MGRLHTPKRAHSPAAPRGKVPRRRRGESIRKQARARHPCGGVPLLADRVGKARRGGASDLSRRGGPLGNPEARHGNPTPRPQVTRTTRVWRQQPFDASRIGEGLALVRQTNPIFTLRMFSLSLSLLEEGREGTLGDRHHPRAFDRPPARHWPDRPRGQRKTQSLRATPGTALTRPASGRGVAVTGASATLT